MCSILMVTGSMIKTEDWFVSVLYQERADAQLFHHILPRRLADLQEEQQRLAWVRKYLKR